MFTKYLLSNKYFDILLGETVVPQKKKTHGLKIYQRFHFASALKRMSVIAGHTPAGSSETEYLGVVKGAPETLQSMVNSLFSNICYDNLKQCIDGVKIRIE